jgi:hypothetical protein
MRKLALTIALAVGLTAPAFADIVKCQQGIEKNGSKLQASILKSLQKCVDSYRKAVASNTLATAGPVCQAGLAKVIDHGNLISAISKTEGALAKLVPPLGSSCTDGDLSALGYLPEAEFGDRWRRLTLLAALGGAYDQEQQAVSDLPNALQGLGANGCPLCAALSARPPCVATVCDVDVTSSFETKVLTAPLTGAIAGNTIVSGCEWQDVLPNEIGLIGGSNVGLKSTVVLGNTVCNAGFRTFGILSCAGSTMPKVTYSLCQDSDTTQGTDCTVGPGTICQAKPDATTGGACIDYSGGAAAQGDAFILSTTRLRTSAGAGPDGVFCTPDDIGVSNTLAAVIPTTTGTASAKVLDYNNTNGDTESEGPLSGTTGPSCAVSRSGSSSGLVLVGAFPGADTVGSPLHDTVTKVTIACH